MLAYFYISTLSSDIKIAVQKNHLVGQIVYRSSVPSKKTASKAFNLHDFEESWVVMNNFISLHEEAAYEYFLQFWTFDPDSVQTDYVDPTAQVFFDQVRYYFMARSIQFCKQSNDDVKSILEPILTPFFRRVGTSVQNLIP